MWVFPFDQGAFVRVGCVCLNDAVGVQVSGSDGACDSAVVRVVDTSVKFIFVQDKVFRLSFCQCDVFQVGFGDGCLVCGVDWEWCDLVERVHLIGVFDRDAQNDCDFVF